MILICLRDVPRISVWAVSCAIYTGAGILPLQAQGEPGTVLDPVEIIGTRDADARWTEPMAVTDYDGGFLQAYGIADFEDLAPLVPGLFVSDQSVENVSFNLRGLTSDTSDPRVRPRVSVFQDGVALTNAHGNNVAFFDLDEIAVFKGPQPARFGEGVESGAIALTSNRAVNESSGVLSAGIGDYNASSVEAVINRPVLTDRLFVRVAVFSDQRDGYVDNLADDSDLQGKGTVAFRTSLRWQPSAATTADLIFNHQRDETPGVAFKTMQGVPGFPAIIDTDPYSAANLNRGSDLGVERTLTGLTGIVSHKLNEIWTLRSVSAWREVDSDHEFDADGTSLYLLELGERFEGRRLSQELRFDYDQGGRFTASTGVNVAWSQDEQTTIIRTNENTLFTYLTGGGIFPFPLNPDYREQNRNVAETTSGDVFGRTDYELTDKLTVGAGLRLTQERLVSRYRSEAAPVAGNLVGAVPTSGGVNNIFQNTAGELENSAEVGSWSGQVDARYEFTPRFATYASISRGRRPPVLHFNAITLAPAKDAEETVWNHEVGIKGASAGRRIRYDASVFRYDFEHFQTQQVVAPGVNAPFDGGRASGQGFETTVAADVVRELTVFATYGYTDATFDDRGEDGEPQAYAGNTFRLTSRHVVSVGGTLSLPVSDDGTFFITPLFVYRSEYYFEDDNAQNGGSLKQEGFGVMNLRIGYYPRNRRWEVVGYMNNVFDKEYLLDAGNTGGTYGFPTAIPAEPRTMGVKAMVRF
ncbi:MAG: TonB-denpendent receptor [Rariglobus sp.]|jgi:outer membrane receptor protein involved in Fe transport|nr:TonB-denpendent receptor [Rariglobus sp.]